MKVSMTNWSAVVDFVFVIVSTLCMPNDPKVEIEDALFVLSIKKKISGRNTTKYSF